MLPHRKIIRVTLVTMGLSGLAILSSCQTQPPQKTAGSIEINRDLAHIAIDFQSSVSGYHCVGAPSVTVATVADCGGENKVETVLFKQTKDVQDTRIEANTQDTLGSPVVAGALDATITIPAAIIDLAADPTQPLSDPLFWDCENCTMTLSGSRFTITTPLNTTRRAFVDDHIRVGTTAGQFNLRMMGCMRLIETSGLGTYANKRGFMCGSNLVSFDQNLNGTGISNYRIMLRNRLRG
jgi:hypothetical protein